MYRRQELQPTRATNLGPVKTSNDTPHLEPRNFEISSHDEDFQLSVISFSDDYGFSVIITLPF